MTEYLAGRTLANMRFGLEFDAINENLLEMIEYFGNDSRKIFADVYIDDKAKIKARYCIPYRAVE